MTAYAPEAWDTFFVAQAGASAALAGLLFVGVSINVAEIAASPRLVRRAGEALILLLEILVLAVVLLVPDASSTALAWGLIGISITAWALITLRDIQIVEQSRRAGEGPAPRGSVAAQIALGQAATIPFVVGALTLLAEAGGGLYWYAPAVVFAYLAVLLDAWVLLIEIQR